MVNQYSDGLQSNLFNYSLYIISLHHTCNACNVKYVILYKPFLVNNVSVLVLLYLLREGGWLLSRLPDVGLEPTPDIAVR